MKPRAFFLVSVARGMAVSEILIYALPALAGEDSIWCSGSIADQLSEKIYPFG